MKKLINKIRKWLIVKLGGYAVPYSEIKYITPKPVRVSAFYKHYRDEIIGEKSLKEYLVHMLAKEIEKSKLYKFNQCADVDRNMIVSQISVFIVNPNKTEGCVEQ